jgi:hypothetical protein
MAANILVVSGLLSVSAGAWVFHPAAGLIVLGAMAVVAGLGVLKNDR